MFFKSPDVYIAGAIIAGYKDTWAICSDLYDQTLDEYKKAGVCCNSDQYVWATTIALHKMFFECVCMGGFDHRRIDPWFHFLDYLSNQHEN